MLLFKAATDALWNGGSTLGPTTDRGGAMTGVISVVLGLGFVIGGLSML